MDPIRSIVRFAFKALPVLTVLVGGNLASAQAPEGVKTLAINEVYLGTAAAAADQFIEIYNPGTTTQYLDGMVIARFGANGGTVTAGTLMRVADAWKFPGKVGGETLPINAGAFIVIANNARRSNGALDLSTANFETFIKGESDNPASNMVRLSSATATGDLKMSIGKDVIALASGTDTTMANGLNASGLYDIISFSNVSGTSGPLPTSLDAAIYAGTDLTYGVSLERKLKGISTACTAVDFEVAAPTPGSQHASVPSSAVKGTDLLPFIQGSYVNYDFYTTTESGAIDPTSKKRASSTVFASNVSFQGNSGVSVVRDSSMITDLQGTEQVSDLHYKADAKSDIQIYADSNFFKLFVPQSFVGLIESPNSFKDYVKLSAGKGKSYPILTLTQEITIPNSPFPGTLNLTATGKFIGIEKLTVPEGTFDSAYRFSTTAHVVVTIIIQEAVNDTIVQDAWYVPGIGLVKSTAPATGAPLSLDGSERRMIAHGSKTLGVNQKDVPSMGLMLYPNPVTNEAQLSWRSSELVTSIELFDAKGARISTMAPSNGSSIRFSMEDLPAGSYMIAVTSGNGGAEKKELLRLVVQR